MPRLIILNGATPNDETGDNLRVTADKINAMTGELYGVFRFESNGNLRIINGGGTISIGDETCKNISIPSCSDSSTPILINPGNGGVVIGPNPDNPLIKVPSNNSTDPITIGAPGRPGITIPGPNSGAPITIGNPIGGSGPTGPVQIGQPGTGITVPAPGSGDSVQIGDPDSGVTVPPPNSTQPIQIGQPGSGITVPPPGSTDPIQIGQPGTGITIPAPGSNEHIQIGDPTQPIKLGDMDPWRLVWTDADGALVSSTNLRVQEAKDEIHSIPGYGEVGRNLQYAGSNIILEPHLDEPDPAHPDFAQTGVAGIYFNRPVTDSRFAEAQNLKALNPTRRAAYIKYWSNATGGEYAGSLELSPWYQSERGYTNVTIDDDYSDGNYDKTLSIKRFKEYLSWGPVVPSSYLGSANSNNPYSTSRYIFNGSSGHQVVSIEGSIDFGTIQAEGGMYKSNVPEFSPSANMGYSYINIPALHTHTGDKWVGQFSSNPKRIREAHGDDYPEADGIPFWSLGYKMSTQLIENFPSMGIAQYERIPDFHAISWDTRGRVSINEANLDETFNILGSIKIQVASSEPNENGVVPLSNARPGRKVTGEENQVGIYFADGTFQYTAAVSGATYTHSAETVTNGAAIRLTGSDESIDDVKIIAGDNVTVERTDADTITISAAASIDTNTLYDLSTGAGMDIYTADIKLTPSDDPLNVDKIFLKVGAVDNVYGLTIESDTNTMTLKHADTSSASTLVASSRTYVTGLTFDTYGHVTAYTTGTETVVDTNTTYTHSAETVTGGAAIRLTGSNSTNDDVKIIGGTNVTVTRTDADTITVSAASGGDTLYDAGTHSSGASLYLDRNNGTIQKVTLASNVTDIVINNMTSAQSFTIIFTQDATGGRTLTTASAFKYASGYKTLSTPGGAIDMLNIFYDGTTYYCTLTTGYA